MSPSARELELSAAFGRTKLWGGWSISVVNSFRTGLPLTVTTSRKATDTPDGNTNQQRPNVVTGVSLIPAGGQSINDWANIAAFSAPVPGTWGHAGANIVRGPRLFQIDAPWRKTRRSRSAQVWFFSRRHLQPVQSSGTRASESELLRAGDLRPHYQPAEHVAHRDGGCRSIQLALRLTF
jgi:hypothetical protein